VVSVRSLWVCVEGDNDLCCVVMASLQLDRGNDHAYQELMVMKTTVRPWRPLIIFLTRTCWLDLRSLTVSLSPRLAISRALLGTGVRGVKAEMRIVVSEKRMVMIWLKNARAQRSWWSSCSQTLFTRLGECADLTSGLKDEDKISDMSRQQMFPSGSSPLCSWTSDTQ
jgi:hypothetical protein